MASGSLNSNDWSYCIVEVLEDRRMFSITLEGSELFVDGTDGDDTIVLRMDDDGKSVRAIVNGDESAPFDLSMTDDEPTRFVGVIVSGGDGNDHIWVDESNGLFEYEVDLRGENGNDTLAGGAEGGRFYGGKGNDDITTGGNAAADGQWDADYVYGNEGADTLRGGDGKDFMKGGRGNDTFLDDGPDDALSGGPDSDTLDDVSMERVTIRGTSGDDQITIGFSDDGDEAVVSLNGVLVETIENHRARRMLVHGEDGNDSIEVVDTLENPLLVGLTHLRGGTGDDTIDGGLGESKKWMYGYEGADVLTCRGGDNRLFGGPGDDQITAGDGKDRVRAGGGNDTVIGGAGNDQLLGNSGDDHIEGNDGNDRILGGRDSDSMFGNDGDDVLIGYRIGRANEPGDELDGGTGEDTLRGIDGEDAVE